MADRIHLEASMIERHIAAIIAEYPELEEDDALRADMLEGSTDLYDVLGRVLDHKLEARGFVQAIGVRKSDLAERHARWQRREDSMDNLMRRIMTAAGVDKVLLPEATVSLAKARNSVEVTDIESLPQGTYSTERKADKATIKALLEGGEDIPGAQLVQGERTLTVRTK